ncbi:MAG: GNAT family N-acetyltransferase [Candidatus Shapirobacteria bacterium]|nr:GNAT family N-acetyltransferase [Candidatus Shapirobacteria bacterium]MDD4410597.1 GNAT family N-acetyltransferase [Candidatus Shapirobacteria bacterium]
MENKIIHTAITKTGKTVSFRYPTIDDAEILMNYINKISAEKSFILLQGEQQSLEEETKWLKDKLEKIDKNKCVYFLGFIDNNLVATAEITLGSFVKKHIGSFGICVAKKYRGEGIGKILMDSVIKESIKNIKDLKIIELEVFANNPIAQELYKKMGFIEFGRMPEGIKHKDNFIDAILMYKKVK